MRRKQASGSGWTKYRITFINRITPNYRLTPGKLEKIKIRQNEDRRWSLVSGLCTLPDGGWVLADGENEVLKRVNSSGIVIDRCPVPGDLIDVCYIVGHDVVALTMGRSHTIALISLGGDKMRQLRTIEISHFGNGITFTNQKLYVASGLGPAIYEYDYSDGRQLREICPKDSEGEDIFYSTEYITSSEDGSRLFITDTKRGLFILDTRTASLIHHQYSVGRIPYGVCLGEDDGLFVATSRNGIIHLDRDGTILSTMITPEMVDRRMPWCVSYDKRTAKLAVAVGGAYDYMFVFMK